MSFKAGLVLDDRFTLGQCLGRDALGDVYDGEQHRVGRTVTIRVLPDSALATAGARERFEAVVRELGALQHPAIPHLIDSGIFEGRPYVVTERIAGETLDALLELHPAMSPDEVQRILVAIAEALEHAHRAGVRHGDLTPGQVIVGRDGRVQVTDLGLGAVLSHDPHPAAMDLLAHASPYVAPELARGTVTDDRCDLYALGAIGYRLLTGRPPYEPGSRAQLITQQAKSGPIAVQQAAVLPEEAVELGLVIDRLLSRSPEERYPSATWALNALRASRKSLTLPDLSADAELLSSGRMPVVEVLPPATPAAIAAIEESPRPSDRPLPAFPAHLASTPPAPRPPEPAPPPITSAAAPPEVRAFAPELDDDLAFPSDHLDADLETELPEARPSRAGELLQMLALVALLAIGYGLAIFERPNETQRVRSATRFGRDTEALSALRSALDKKPEDARLHAAIGFAQLFAGSGPEAISELGKAAFSPEALEDSDVVALVALLAAPGELSTQAQRTLERSGSRTLTALREAFEQPEDVYHKCRIADVRAALGDQVDVTAVCLEALQTRSCGQRAVIATRLAAKAEQRAVEPLRQLLGQSCAEAELTAALEQLTAPPPPVH